MIARLYTALTALLLLSVPAWSCSDTISTTALSLSDPEAMALVCQVLEGDSWVSAPMEACDDENEDQRLMAFVVNGPSGDVGILNLTSGKAVDTDSTIPGYTRLFVGGWLADIAAPQGSGLLYALNTAPPQVVTINSADLSVDKYPLPTCGPTLYFDAPSGTLLLPVPEAGGLLQVELGQDGYPTGHKMHKIEGQPLHLADAGMGRLLVGHTTLQHLTVVDRDTMDIITRVGIVPPCQDGLDNDEDGAADGDDSGCLDPLDFDETDGEPCGEDPLDRYCAEQQTRACNNGLDDDGDGLADLLDPGCLDRRDNTEWTDNPACNDGLDNDGDGSIDLKDGGCESGTDRFEGHTKTVNGYLAGCENGVDDDGDGLVDLDDPNCSTADDWEILPYPCANGLDDDGDGLSDFPKDPDCFSAGATSEKKLPASMARPFVSPDGRWAYVVHRGLGTISVVDLETMKLVNINTMDDSVHRELRRRRNEWAIQFTGEPVAVTFRNEEVGEVKALRAYVTDIIGQLSVVDVEKDGQPLHLIQESLEEDEEPDVSIAAKPHLYVDDKEIQMGFAPVVGHPNMGQLLVETIDEDTGKKSYYGIEFRDDYDEFRRSQLSETWHLEYQGALPELTSVEGRVLDSTMLAVPGLNMCAAGALAGDYLVIEDAPYGGCETFSGGEDVNYTIAAAGRDWMVIEPGSGWKVGLEDQEPVGDLDPACFPLGATFSVRAKGDFVVRGSRTGYLHNVVDTPEGCVDVTQLLLVNAEAPAPAGLFAGRAFPGEIATANPLPSCPITKAQEGIVKVEQFSNAVFTLTMYPACTIDINGQYFRTDPVRDTRWAFSVGSGFTSKVILVASLPSDMELHDPTQSLYVLDLAGKSIKEVDLEDFSLVQAFF